MLTVRPLFLGAAMLLLSCAQAEPSVGAVTVSLGNIAVDLRSADPADKTIGKLIYRGGASVVPANHTDLFGGLSALRVSADGTRFAAVTDQGHWVEGTLAYAANGDLAGMGGTAEIGPLHEGDGSAITNKKRGDSEGMAFADPYDLKGDAFVSFEGDHRVERYAATGTGNPLEGAAHPIAMPDALQQLGSNSGLEVLASLGHGKLVAIAEEGPGGEDDDSPGWIVDTATGTASQFTVKRNLPYALTDATLLPDGRLLVLGRRFSPLTGPGAELRVFDPAKMVEGATVEGELIATLFGGVTVDNMEGISARRTEDGRTLIYVVSDDNFQRPLQRTLIMMFELTGS